eukprot:GFYU01013706.1.p1 GENE.GFYU01013706.1~~GFYU01013706.1.p1  ORF type:complete len:525 (-),score=94.06 GFYU01013706.1:73-1647(-)
MTSRRLKRSNSLEQLQIFNYQSWSDVQIVRHTWKGPIFHQKGEAVQELERLHEEAVFRGQKSTIRGALALLTVLYMAWGVFDLENVHPTQRLAIRYVTSIVPITFLILMKFRPDWIRRKRRWRHGLNLGFMAIVGSMHAMEFISDGFGTAWPAVVTCVSLTAYHSFTSVSFTSGVFFGTLVTISTMFFYVSLEADVASPLLVLVVNVAGCFAVWKSQRSSKNGFLVNLQLDSSKKMGELILRNTLPDRIIDQIHQGKSQIAEHVPEATILFADIVGFTNMSTKKDPTELVSMLNTIFTAFDHLCHRHSLEKIKTIGDAYMVAGGLTGVGVQAQETVAMGLAMVKQVEFIARDLGEDLSIRVGIHTGQVVAGVIGVERFAYDVWGDTVNQASRLESTGEAGSVVISEAVKNKLEDYFHVEFMGQKTMKGLGAVDTYVAVKQTRQLPAAPGHGMNGNGNGRPKSNSVQLSLNSRRDSSGSGSGSGDVKELDTWEGGSSSDSDSRTDSSSDWSDRHSRDRRSRGNRV